MKKLLANSFWFLVAGFWLPVALQAHPLAPSPVERGQPAATCAIDWLRGHLWIRELTGHNDGPAVAALIRENDGQPREEWCGDTQAKAQRVCGLPVPAASNGSYNWFRDKVRTFFLVGVRGNVSLIQPGHLVGIYNQAKGRIAHITRAVEVVPPLRPGRPPRGFYCIGGNEGIGRNAGIHLTFYPAASLHAGADWSTPYASLPHPAAATPTGPASRRLVALEWRYLRLALVAASPAQSGPGPRAGGARRPRRRDGPALHHLPA